MFNKNIALYSAEQSKALDELALDHLSLRSNILMRRAAKFAFDVALKRWPDLRSVSIFAGKGNNAADAFLFAGLAQHYGIKVQLFRLGDLSKLNEEAQSGYSKLVPSLLEEESSLGNVRGDLIVDGLIGTGLRGSVEGDYAEAIRLINKSDVPVLSLDIPSGVNASTGGVASDAVMADLTTTFICRKVGMHTGKGLLHSGEILMDQLGVSRELYSPQPSIELSFYNSMMLPVLPIDTYKNQQGHLLIIGGDEGMPGSVLMAAEAALRSGAGLVTIATRKEHLSTLVSRLPEVMVVEASVQVLKTALSKYDAVLIGPGLGRNNWGKRLYRSCLNLNMPFVIDADGLFWMASEGCPASDSVIVSPHLGEAARLLDVESSSIEGDRIDSAMQIKNKYGVAGVLKGPGSVLFGREKTSICGHGNPGMAAAGMGDVLSGIIAGFLVQKNIDFDVGLETAVLLHSAAADEAAGVLGQRSLIATDVINFLPQVMQSG